MEGNAFIANKQQVMYVATREQDWSGNYWSDYLGWDLDDNGVGDTAHEPMTPWIIFSGATLCAPVDAKSCGVGTALGATSVPGVSSPGSETARP